MAAGSMMVGWRSWVVWIAVVGSDEPPIDAARIEELDRGVQELQRAFAGGDAGAGAGLAEARLELEQALPHLAEESRRHAELVLYKIDSAAARFDTTLAAEERSLTLERALRSADASGSPEPRARARLILAEDRMIAGRFVDAEEHLRSALAIADARGTRPFVWHAQAELCRQLGRHREALAALDEAEASTPDGPWWRSLSWRVPGTRGHVYLELGLFDLAAREIAIERAACEGLRSRGPGFARDVIRSQIHQANLALAYGHDDEVVSLVEGFLADTELYGPGAPWRAELMVVRGLACGRIARQDRVPPIAPSVALREALASPDLPTRERAACEVELADELLRTGDWAGAESLLDQAGRRLDGFRAERHRDDELVEDVDLAMTRARLAMAQGVSGDALRPHVDAFARAVRARLVLWAAAPLRPGGLGFLQPRTRRVWLSELIRGLVAVDGEELGARRALDELVEVQRYGTLVRGRGGVDEGVDEMLDALLPPGRALSLYLPAPERSHLLWVDALGARHVELARESELERLRLRLHEALDGGPDEDATAAAAALARALLPERIRARLSECRQLDIVGADLLGSVPFELLPLGDDDALGLSHAVAHLPSLPLAHLLASTGAAREPAELAYFLVAAPEVSPEVRERFPEAVDLSLPSRDLERLTSSLAGPSQALVGPHATRAATLASDLSRVSVVQFLCHSVQDYTRERPARLVLGASGGDDGLLGCEDVERMPAPRLVLLTACRTGRGPARRGDDGAGHLGGAWLAAGAEVVVLSDQDLEYELALQVSERFLTALGDGLSPAEAMSRARRSLLDDGVAASPVRTGGFRVVGRGHAPLFSPDRRDRPAPSRSRRVEAMVAAVAVLLVAALAMRRRSG